MNDEKLHGITYEITVHASREIIQEAAETGVGYEPEFIRACREWLANNPQGMTRDEFNALPDGSVVRLDDSIEYIKVGNRLGLTNHFDRVAWLRLDDQSLPDMTVVSTPPAPTLDDVDVVLSDAGWIWKHDGYGWQRLVPDGGQFRSVPTCELENQVGPLTPLLPGSQIGGEA